MQVFKKNKNLYLGRRTLLILAPEARQVSITKPQS